MHTEAMQISMSSVQRSTRPKAPPAKTSLAKAPQPHRIQKMPVEVQATQALRTDIVTGALAPGARLTEMKLAADFGLSRATIRTALQQLTKEGLVLQTPYTGWAVVTLTPKSAWELYTLRSALEGLAARLSAEALTAEARATLEQAFAALVEVCGRNAPDAIADADFTLHKTIIALANHSRLEFQYQMVEQQIRMYIRCSDGFISDPSEIVEQHRAIVSSILSGTPDAAAHESERHNLLEGRRLVAALEAQATG